MKSFREYLDETIRRYGPAGDSHGKGYTLDEEQVDEHGGGIGPAKSWQSYMEDEGEGQLALKTLELEPTGPASDQIDESQMAEADAVIQDIINGEQDAYQVMTNPTTPAERYVAQIVSNMYDSAQTDYGLHADDDFEKIMKIIQQRLEDEYGRDEELSESTKALYRVLELADVNKGK